MGEIFANAFSVIFALAVLAVAFSKVVEHWDAVLAGAFALACLIAAIAIGYLGWRLSRFGSWALPLSIVGAAAWFIGRKFPLVRAGASTAGALSIGFGAFAALYMVLDHRTYADAAQWASAGDLAWKVETALLAARHLLQHTFAGFTWLCLCAALLLCLAITSERVRSSGLVSSFVHLREWISRSTFALIAATTFTMLLPLDAGAVVDKRFDAIQGGIEAAIRDTTDSMSRALAAEVVASEMASLPQESRTQFQTLIHQVAEQRDTPQGQNPAAGESSFTIGAEDKSRPIVDLIRASTSVHAVVLSEAVAAESGASDPGAAESRPISPDSDLRERWRQVSSLQQQAAEFAEQEKRKAIEVVCAEFISAASPDLKGPVGDFVGVLVDTIAGSISERMTALYAKAWDSARMRTLVQSLSARLNGLRQPVVTVAPKVAEIPPNVDPNAHIDSPERSGTPSTDTWGRKQARKHDLDNSLEAGISRMEAEARRRGILVEELAREKEQRLREMREARLRRAVP